MLTTQNYSDLGRPVKMHIISVYYDEVELTDQRGYGKSIKEHIDTLVERSNSNNSIVINCKFEHRSGHSHRSYGTIIVSVVGDLCDSLP